MDDAEDDARYPPNPRGGNQKSGYGAAADTQKLHSRLASNQYLGDEDDDDDDEDDEEEIGGGVGGRNHQNNGIREGANDLDDEEDEDDSDDDDDDDEDEDGDNADPLKNFGGSAGASERRTKKRKLKSLVSSYEFAPRVLPAQAEPAAAGQSSTPKASSGGRNALTDWTETETFVLLDAWGDRFLQHGRKSLRSEEWQEVAEKVSEVSKIERTDAQCRNRLDTLKKKYKKEKAKLSGEGGSALTKWIYFRKMDALMSSPPQKQSQAAGLSCGVDSGEYVFMNPRVFLNRVNGMDEMRDSPGNSEFSNRDDEDDDSDGLPPKKRSRRESKSNEGSSFKLLADSIFKFSDVYEKMENRKSQQMVEIERMRMEFQRDLEVQRRQIVERAHAEIAKIMECDDENDEENDHDQSGENPSG